MKYLIIVACISAICLGCTQDRIVNEKDYKHFLNPAFHTAAINKHQSEINFWNLRLQQDTGSYMNMLLMGDHYLSLFKLSGNIKNLVTGDSLFQRAAQKLNDTDPAIIQARCQIEITKHHFKNIPAYNEKALKQNGSRYAYLLLAFDAGMELGQYHTAGLQLNQISDKSSFHFLIRKAKYEDHQGDINTAIKYMESAFDQIEHTNNAALYCWTLANLGDMYGHAGRIKDAYTSYLKTLQKDASYLHALKGIAWIAYALDRNVKGALDILHFIDERIDAPEISLTLAEIMEYMGNTTAKADYIKRFMLVASLPEYGDMYNKYLIELMAEVPASRNKALALAQREITNRATPETYSWLSWVYYQMGAHEKAYGIYKTYVEGRTFEPEALLKGSYIFTGADQKEKAKTLFKECLKSSFELGPLKTGQIKDDLNRL